MNILAWFVGPTEMIAIGVVGVLLFGRRLPEVGKNLGKGLMSFKKSLSGATDEIGEVGQAVSEAGDDATAGAAAATAGAAAAADQTPGEAKTDEEDTPTA